MVERVMLLMPRGKAKARVVGTAVAKGMPRATVASLTDLPWWCKQCKCNNARGNKFCRLCGTKKSLAQSQTHNDTDAILQKSKKLEEENRRLRQGIKDGKTWTDVVKYDSGQKTTNDGKGC